ncbi:ABC transporter ATP-binding protein [Cellulomonas soli]|uniref:ABC transporter ATP-binding protein n=1 Tax=Cellulomonas soli TaxID=931535 RepID=UPI003F84C52B
MTDTTTRSTREVTTDASRPATTHTLAVHGASIGYEDRLVVQDMTLEVPSGRITTIVGANACGKSTLLRAMARLLRVRSGSVLLDGTPIDAIPSREVATVLGLLPQSPVSPEGIAVADLVGRGRYPHQGWFRRWTREDDAAVEEALRATDTLDLADRPVDELSGGQRQRVWIAMALAQQTEVLLLDEPTTFLDVSHQVEVLDLLTDLNRSRGTTIVLVLHDLNLASRYTDHLVALRDGRLVVQGAPRDVITPALVSQVFGLAAQVVPDPVSGTPLVVPIGRHHGAPVRPAHG